MTDKESLKRRVLDLEDEEALGDLILTLIREGLGKKQKYSLIVYLHMMEVKKKNHPLLECSVVEYVRRHLEESPTPYLEWLEPHVLQAHEFLEAL